MPEEGRDEGTNLGLLALVERVGTELSFAEHEETLVVRDGVEAVASAFGRKAGEINSLSCSRFVSRERPSERKKVTHQTCSHSQELQEERSEGLG